MGKELQNPCTLEFGHGCGERPLAALPAGRRLAECFFYSRVKAKGLSSLAAPARLCADKNYNTIAL